MAYAYGKGLAIAPESEGNFNLVLGGSFEPGKLFTVSAYVQEPAAGQSLTLDLPPGMARLEGKEIQPVAPPSGDRSESLVLWKARVARILASSNSASCRALASRKRKKSPSPRWTGPSRTCYFFASSSRNR